MEGGSGSSELKVGGIVEGLSFYKLGVEYIR